MGEEKFSAIAGRRRRFPPSPQQAAVSGLLRNRHSRKARLLPRKAGFFPFNSAQTPPIQGAQRQAPQEEQSAQLAGHRQLAVSRC
jgi:hypothetical protein